MRIEFHQKEEPIFLRKNIKSPKEELSLPEFENTFFIYLLNNSFLSINFTRMSYSNKKSYKDQTSKQSQKNTQKLIQDQNYSNEIFFGVLSTIESLTLHYQGKSNQFHNKMMKNYDQVNYSSKSIK